MTSRGLAQVPDVFVYLVADAGESGDAAASSSSSWMAGLEAADRDDVAHTDPTP